MDIKRYKRSQSSSRPSEVADMEIEHHFKRSKPRSRPREEDGDGLNEVRSSAGGKSHEIIPHLGFDLLALPEDLVQEILLKQCRRGEAVSKLVCRGFNQRMQTRPYMLARQRILDPQEPRYCCLLLPKNITQNSRGWDPVGNKWVGLPSLGFLQTACRNVDGNSIGRMELRRVCCADNGLLGVTVHVNTRRYVDDMDSCETLGFVCNPLTRSYVVIPNADAYMETGFTVMRAGEGGSGFRLYAAPRSGAGHGHGQIAVMDMYKLESFNLAAGWQRVEPLPQAVLDVVSAALPLLDNALPPVALGSMIYRLYVCHTFDLLLVSYHMDEGLWKVDRVADSRVIPVKSVEGTNLQWKKVRLLNVGSRLWLVQMVQVPVGWVKATERVMISRYEPLDRTFILVQTCHLPVLDDRAEEGVFGQSTICFMPLSYRIPPITYDVFTQRWFQCPAPPGLNLMECHFGGTFHLTGASAK